MSRRCVTFSRRTTPPLLVPPDRYARKMLWRDVLYWTPEQKWVLVMLFAAVCPGPGTARIPRPWLDGRRGDGGERPR